MTHNLFNTLKEFSPGAGKKGQFYSLPALEKAGIGKISRLTGMSRSTAHARHAIRLSSLCRRFSLHAKGSR